MNPLAIAVPTGIPGALPQLPAASRVLIIDDDARCTSALARLLRRAGLETVQTTSDPTHGVALFQEQEPDLVLLDLHMPRIDGFHLLTLLRRPNPDGPPVPIVMLTGDSEPQCRYRALAQGASDFLLKPLDPIEVLLRVRAQLETRELQRRLARHNQTLEVAIAARTRELEAAQVEMLGRLAVAAELHDDETGQHTQRVGELAGRLARALDLPRAQVDLITRAAPLHDVGKIGIPDAILRKPGKLTAEEFGQMKTHATVGAQILAGGRSELIQMAERIARHHHERWDGTGYPVGLRSVAIPLEARIVAVADFYDALTHDRPYRPAFSLEYTLGQLQAGSGSHFDPAVVHALLETANGPARPTTSCRPVAGGEAAA